MTESLLLKWGTVKSWHDLTERSKEIMTRYFEEGIPTSCMADHPDNNRKQIICELIDQFSGEIHNDWSGEQMSKDEAKKYIMEYRP